MDNVILPLGQHRLDPSPDFDPIRSLLRSLSTDTLWISERIASIAAAGDDGAEMRREMAYLRGDVDDALPNLARLIELLFAGYRVDLGKRIGRGSSPPYFQNGVSMAAEAIPRLGQHELDPPLHVDAVRFFLASTKTHLVDLDEHRAAFQQAWESGCADAAQEMMEMQRLVQVGRRHVARLIEVLLAGYGIDRDRSGPDQDSLRLFKPCGEAEWLSCPRIDSLCKILRHRDYGVTVRFSDRKWQLFGVACVRRVRHTLRDERTAGLVEGVEQLADGLLTEEEVRQQRSQVRNPPNPDTEFPEDWHSEEGMARCAYQALLAIPLRWADAARAADSARWARRATRQPEHEEQAQVALLRDVFGNPFRQISLDPSWRTSTVLSLAQAAYSERLLPSGHLDPVRLAILADALEEAGCTDRVILDHLRGPDLHTRGCFAVDLALARK